MARRATKDMTVEEFDRWCAARRDVDEVMEVTAEERRVGHQRLRRVARDADLGVRLLKMSEGHETLLDYPVHQRVLNVAPHDRAILE